MKNAEFRNKKTVVPASQTTHAYLRVPADCLGLVDQRRGILDYLKSKNIADCYFVEEKISASRQDKYRKLTKLVDKLASGDLLVVSELSMLGRDTADILRLLSHLVENGIAVHDVKEQHDIDYAIESRSLSLVMCMAADISRDLTSRISRESIALRRHKGMPIGRPKGSKSASKLDPFKCDIEQLRTMGVSKSALARKYSVSWPTVDTFCQRHGC